MRKKPLVQLPTSEMLDEVSRLTKNTRYRKLPAKEGRVAALAKLHARLIDDAMLYDQGNLQDQRDAVADSLLAVVDFLLAQGFNHATLGPLMRPVAALAERENNSIDIMFSQRVRAGRPSATLADHERTGILAALSDAWLREHFDDERRQSDKLSEAARKLKGRWFGRLSRANLETAREIVSQEASDHPAVIAYRKFNEYIETAESTYGTNGAIKILVRFLNDQKVSFGLGEGGILKTPPISPTENN